MNLSDDELRNILDAAVRAGLVAARAALLTGIDQALVLGLTVAPNPLAQVRVDLAELNQADLPDGTNPVAQWLRNAVTLAGPRREAEVLRAALTLLTTEPPGPVARPMAAATLPQKSLLDLEAREFWPQPAASELLDLLEALCHDETSLRRNCARVEVSLGDIDLRQGFKNVWFEVINSARQQGKLKPLFEVLLAEYGGMRKKILELLAT
jgi:Effector-associated domain 5/Effector-associated domain 1